MKKRNYSIQKYVVKKNYTSIKIVDAHASRQDHSRWNIRFADAAGIHFVNKNYIVNTDFVASKDYVTVGETVVFEESDIGSVMKYL